MNSRFAALIGFSLALQSVHSHADTTVEQLGWISGHWCSSNKDQRIEEIWLPAHGGVLLGMSRTLDGETTNNFEYLRIVMENHRPTYVAQPGGRPPVGFQRSDGNEDWVRFENPDHDFPKRIEYRRVGDTLHASVAGPGEDGNEIEISVDYHICRE